MSAHYYLLLLTRCREPEWGYGSETREEEKTGCMMLLSIVDVMMPLILYIEKNVFPKV